MNEELPRAYLVFAPIRDHIQLVNQASFALCTRKWRHYEYTNRRIVDRDHILPMEVQRLEIYKRREQDFRQNEQGTTAC